MANEIDRLQALRAGGHATLRQGLIEACLLRSLLRQAPRHFAALAAFVRGDSSAANASPNSQDNLDFLRNCGHLSPRGDVPPLVRAIVLAASLDSPTSDNHTAVSLARAGRQDARRATGTRLRYGARPVARCLTANKKDSIDCMFGDLDH